MIQAPGHPSDPDHRPEDVLSAMEMGSTFEEAMDSVYLDENGDKPSWTPDDAKRVREAIAQLKRDADES